MRLRLIVTLVLLMSLVVPTATSEASRAALQKKRSKPIFVFHTDEFWLNLHHFLYVLGRAQNKTADSAREAVNKAPAEQEKGLTTLSPTERNVWNEAVTAYAATFSKKDLVFDDPMPAIAKALARAGEARTLTTNEIDPAIPATLQRAGPIYRKAWWPEHKRANKSWQLAIQKLVAQHGPTVLNFITRSYQESWPEAGYAVHLSAFANWAGAYSTEGNLLVVSTLAEGNRGLYALETIFHEAMHQWDDQISEALQTQARLQNKSAPRGLSHAMIFFTAGEAIRKLDAAYVPYAEKAGVWQRGLLQFKQPLEQIWKPYLDGKGTRDEALAQLIKVTK
ncbi:MAG TPA: hypothetical protein VFI24_14615 [Pyrinomonadaceae bacterium]|nr:hypothetical protein [Pyrinomonadaceae bacterium]